MAVRRWMAAWLCLPVMWGGATGAFGATEVAAAKPPPLTAFASLPALRGLSMSPDGQRLAGIMNRDGNSVIVTAKWDGSEMIRLMETDNSKFKFGWVKWVNNNRLVLSTHFPDRRGGAATEETRGFAIDADGKNSISLVPPSRNKQFGQLPQTQDDVIDWMPEDGHHILMSIVQDWEVYAPGVYRVDVDTGSRELVLGPRGGIWNWIADRQHRVRMGTKIVDGKVEIKARGPAG